VRGPFFDTCRTNGEIKTNQVCVTLKGITVVGFSDIKDTDNWVELSLL
jgi:hypothetical protein